MLRFGRRRNRDWRRKMSTLKEKTASRASIGNRMEALGRLFGSAVASYVATDNAMGDTHSAYGLLQAYEEAILREEPHCTADCRLMLVAIISKLRFLVTDRKPGTTISDQDWSDLNLCRQAAEEMFICL